MDPVLAGGLFGVGGVILGAVLSDVSAKRGHKQARDEQRADERRAREVIVAEKLDGALVLASASVDFTSTHALVKAFQKARIAWEEAWVAYSPRISQPELLARYSAVGRILNEYAFNDTPIDSSSRRIVQRAIANARSTLAHFMRGDDLQDPAFPEGDELGRLLGEGDGTDDPMGPLKAWLATHELPEFHQSLEDSPW
jgi:hypothetical protein